VQWGDREILVHDADAVDLGRLRALGVTLWNHDSDVPIGRLEDVTLDAGARRCRATVRFDDDDASDRIWRKVLSGTLRGVSVGYRVSVWEHVEAGARSADGRFEGDCWLARRWEPLEVSIVSVPADATVGVGRSLGAAKDDEGGRRMNEDEIRTLVAQAVADAVRAAVPPAAPEAPENPAARERERMTAVVTACREYGLEPEPYLAQGTVEDVRKAALDRLVAERRPVGVEIQADERDKFRAAAVDGMLLRDAQTRVAKPAAGAESFRGCSLLEMARACLERSGERVPWGGDRMELAKRAIGSSDFPLIMANVANKTLQAQYGAVPTTWQTWAGTGSVPDFKTNYRVRLSEAPNLDLLPEHGEYKMAQFSEARVSYSIATYGKKYALTRQAIINDDLGALTRIPGMFGRSAARLVNKSVYGVLNTNGTMPDGVALFHANHGNLVASGSGGAPSIATLDAALVAMASQTGLNGLDKIGIEGRFLIVPPGKKTAAKQLLASTVDPTKSNAVPNPMQGALELVSDPELSSSTAWFVAAAPGEGVDTVEVFFLDGVQAPLLESREDWDTDGIVYKTRIDFGVACLDHRGLFMNYGA